MPDQKERRDGSMREEVSAFGERAKGAAKDAVGAVTGNSSLEREGEQENARGRARQAQNDAVGADQYRTNYVTGIYTTPEHAGLAYHELTTQHGYRPDDVTVLMSDSTRARHFGDVKPGHEFREGTKAAEGAGVGGGIGAGAGAALGAIVAAATAIAVPGLGLVVAGPIAGAIAGAGAGGVTGGLIGALVGAGIPEDRAKEYDRGVREGGIVIGTRARDDQHAAELERGFRGAGARNVLR